MKARRGRIVSVILLACVAVLLRVALADRHGLWADEFFSLAMATGHSLEHPAAEAVPALGDFVESPDAAPATSWRRYLEHEHPPASAARVVTRGPALRYQPPTVLLASPPMDPRVGYDGPGAATVLGALGARRLPPVVPGGLFDLLRGTHASLVSRYALAGLPAAMLLAGMAMSRLGPVLNATFLALVAVAWLPGIRVVFLNGRGFWGGYRQVAVKVAGWARPSDLVIVHSIPSGVVGIGALPHP